MPFGLRSPRVHWRHLRDTGYPVLLCVRRGKCAPNASTTSRPAHAMTTPAQSAGSTLHAVSVFGCGANSCDHGSESNLEYSMLKFKLTHRRAKRWGRRAKSDGSCVPGFKGIPYIRNSRHIRLLQISMALAIFVWSGAVLGLIGLQLFLVTDHAWWFGVDLSSWHSDAAFKVVQWINFSCGCFVVVYVMAVIKIAVSTKRQAARGRFCLCPRCGYDLSQRMDDTEPCPECGQRISRRECIRLWARFCGR